MAFAAAGGAAGGLGGFAAGAAAGAASTAAMMPVQSAGNSMYFGDPFITWQSYVLGIAGGALTGGVGNGTVAALKGNNFWTGKDVQFGRGSFSFNNTPTRPAPEMKMLEAPKASLNAKQANIGEISEEMKGLSQSNMESASIQAQPSGTTRFVATPDGVIHDLQPTINRIQSGDLYTFSHDGSVYYNKEGLLPKLSNGVYKEYVHPTPGIVNRPGAMRILTGGNSMWFTPDHYKTMIRIKF